MRIAVTGRTGQVARSLEELSRLTPGLDVVLLGRPDFDLVDPESVRKAILSAVPDIVVSAAAYTAVDKAEDDKELAFKVNALGAGYVAACAEEAGAAVVHLSTDYVFDGTKDGPYIESDPPLPLGIYGSTKLAGEQAVLRANSRALILRTAWVYSPFGKNFVKTMLMLAQDRDEISVVSDQIGSPTSALDIAEAIAMVAKRLESDRSFDQFGVYNLVGTGSVSWSGFARQIFEVSQMLGGPRATVTDIPTSAYPTAARRPANSRLCTDKFALTFDHRLPDWRSSVRTVIERLIAG